ncbi:TATA-box-binding protein isoform X2 [Anoplophora glabripennis]|uniref:TATA-box-binding protein isoform X2 n=1 Tax=Anoplophora glabripennis TaxID=217634 RepID=UPI0008751EBF|nr:TATA-box-binding protein isoform X2 [Anoplophora glabripennis]
MDQMLPSPGFSIPSIGTPLHQPEEDQMILPNALQQQQQASTSTVPPLAPMGGLTPTLGLGMGQAMTMPQTKYVTGFALPMGNMTTQTPVS